MEGLMNEVIINLLWMNWNVKPLGMLNKFQKSNDFIFKPLMFQKLSNLIRLDRFEQTNEINN